MRKSEVSQETASLSTQDRQGVIRARQFSAYFGEDVILKNVHLTVPPNQITCLIGPSGSGKSTLIRSVNRMNEEDPSFRCQGDLYFREQNINESTTDVTELRTQIGMVFQKPCVFPTSVYENVLFGARHHRDLSQQEAEQIVRQYLQAVSLWEEVHHRLQTPAPRLSAGQQQRLCLARTLAVQPDLVMLDEPTSALDPVASRSIEDLMLSLKKNYSLLFVTHNIQQAQRIADHLIFLCNGQVIESGPKEQLFHHPQSPQTRSYLQEEYCDC